MLLTAFKIVDETDCPLSVQENVNASFSASLALATSVSEFGRATAAPVAAGVCDAQTGGVFFTTVKVFVVVLVAFETVATKVLEACVSCDERMATLVVVALRALPLSAQVTPHEASLGVTPKVVEVEPAAATRVELVDGVEAVTAHAG